MSFEWADFPDGQIGLYGYDINPLLEGVYAQNNACLLVIDPDTTLLNRGAVLELTVTGGGGGNYALLRYVLQTTHATVGVAQRWRLASLPSASDRRPWPVIWCDAGNVEIARLEVTTTGAIAAYVGGVLAGTSSPVLRAGDWQHIESILTCDTGGSGTLEVRVEGVTKLSLTGLTTSASIVSQLQFANDPSGTSAGVTCYMKDLVIYNGAGTRFNDFLGNATVNDLYPNADTDLQWDPSSGSLGYPLIKDNTPGNRLTLTGTISNAEVLQIGGVYYKWTSGSVDSGSPAGTSANPWLVALGATAQDSLQYVWEAINATGTPGTTYSTALTQHPTMKAVGYTDTLLEVEPQDGITTGQSCTETMANAAWASSVTFWYGPSDTTYLQAGYTPAVSATGSFTVSGGVPIADETFAIGANTWTFKASRTTSFEVPIGADAATTATNMITYINVDQTAGVVASSGGSGVAAITAATGGTAGNSITTTSSATHVSAAAGTLAGGVNTVYPDPDIVAFTDLDADVTSVKGLMSIVRAGKTDGGDGDLQVSLSPNGSNWDDGTNHPLSTAQTYYWDTSEVSPATSGPWTVAEVDALEGKLNRTL